MVSEKDFKYYVVELTESPIANSYKYVCIPSSWIKYQEITGGEVIIKYPIEKKSVTKKRIKKREESADHWQIHSVDIKLGTNSYKEATNYIKILNKISKQDETEIMVDGVPLKLGRTCEANVQTISTLLSDNVEPMSNKKSEQVSNQTSLTASKDECQEEIKVGDSSSKIKRYFTRRTNKMSSSTVSVDQTEKNNTPETSTCGKEIVKSSQKDDSSVKSCQVITDNFILREALRKVLGNNYKEKVGMIYDDYKSRYEIFKLLCDDSLQHCKIWKALMDEILDDDNNGQEANSRTNRKVIWSDIRNNNDDMDETDKDNNNSEDNKSSDKIRGQARKFTLPPEYDPEDSKWTLKHREYKEGLVELIPNS